MVLKIFFAGSYGAKIVSNDVLHTLVFDPYLIVDSDDFLSLMKFSLFDLPLPFWLLPLP